MGLFYDQQMISSIQNVTVILEILAIAVLLYMMKTIQKQEPRI